MPTTIDGTTGASQIQDGTVTTDKIANDAVTTAKIGNSQVTVPKIGATGTANNTTFLRGDGAWQAVQTGPATGDTLTTTRTLSAPDYLPTSGAVYLQSSYPALFAQLGLQAISSSGATWTNRTGATAFSHYAVAYGNNLFVAVGATTSSFNAASVNTSPDGVTWTSRTSGQSGTSVYFQAVTFGSNLFVAAGSVGCMSTSTDGINWTSRTSGFGTQSINSIAFGNGVYVAVGSAGTITSSTNGTTWTSRTSQFGADNIVSVTYGNGLFVAVGWAGKISTSPDGVTWTARTSGFGNHTIISVTYGNGIFVAAGAQPAGRSIVSFDGIHWTPFPHITGGSNTQSLSFGAGLFIAGGGNGEILTSTNGTTWTVRPNAGSVTVGFNGSAYGNGNYVIVGASNTIQSSSLGYTPTTQFAVPFSLSSTPGATSYIKA